MKSISRKEFFKLSVPERRVAIAKDILLRIKSGSFVGESGLFAHVSGDDVKYKQRSEYKSVDVENSTCEVCAKGAIACSWFINLNLHDFGEFHLHNNNTEAMDEIFETFGENLWDTIECLFEGWNVQEVDTLKYTEEDADAINNYMERLFKTEPSQTSIMKKIFENIVRNKGNLLIPIKKKKGFLITQ